MKNKLVTPIITEHWIDIPEDSLTYELKKTRRHMICDTSERFIKSGLFAPPIVVSNDSVLKSYVSELDVVWEESIPSDRHTGSLVDRVVKKYKLEKVMPFGGGSCFFLSDEELSFISKNTRSDSFISNNLFSSDFICFDAADISDKLSSLPHQDNMFAYYLKNTLKLSFIPMAPTIGTIFDVDTPIDVLLMKKYIDFDSRTKNAIEFSFDRIDFDKLLCAMDTRDAETFLYGRINPRYISKFEKKTLGRMRYISEERGMKTRGKASGSILGDLNDPYIRSSFWKTFSKLFDCAVMDTRAIANLFSEHTFGEELYLSDLLLWEKLEDPFMKQFTKDALDTGIPILFGGHSLVNGGLMILGELLKRRRKA